MNYKDCKKNLEKLNDEICNKIETDFSTEIDEIFIASSDNNEMMEDLKIIHNFDYGHSEIKPTSENDDYSIYILDDKGAIHYIDEKYFE